MIDLPDKIASLSAVPPFDRLTAHELAAVAQVMRARQFAPGEIIFESHSAPGIVAVCVAGSMQDERGPVGCVHDVPAVLFGLAVESECTAGPDGATVLVLARTHLFTLARECPDFIVGLLPEDIGSSASC